MNKTLLPLPIAAISRAVGCLVGTTEPRDVATASVAVDPHYTVDMNALNGLWAHGSQLATVEDAFRVAVKVGPQTVPADTHLFGPEGQRDVVAIPYHDLDAEGTLSPAALAESAGLSDLPSPVDAAGNPIARGDAELSRYFAPGEIGYAIKHHRQEHRVLQMQGAGPEMKENFKLQDTHIELVVGVTRDGQPGVVTLNNPQGYPGDYVPGRFGDEGYPMIFVRPEFPGYLSTDVQRAFVDNIRTMMVGFNAVSEFPGNYNGGDPLGARNPERVREHVKNMVLAIAGTGAARTAATAYFANPENQVYCAELGHVATTAGLLVPLNRASLQSLGLPTKVINKFARYVATQPDTAEREATPFVQMNENQMVTYVDMTMAPDSLQPAASYAPSDIRAAEEAKLAFGPMTMADIVERFMATHLPRRTLGEQLAPMQGAVLEAMKPGLLETMGMDQLPASDPKRMAVEALFGALVAKVKTPYASYEAFRADLAPLMDQARMITGPRGDSGAGLFVPPSMYHVIALDAENPPPNNQGWHLRGLVSLRYVGHGIPFSAMRPVGGATDPDQPVDPVEPAVGGMNEQGSMNEGEWKYFTVSVAAGQNLNVNMVPQGDIDLYVRFGSQPTADEFDCGPYLGANEAESCPMPAAETAGTYHIALNAYTAGSYVLTAASSAAAGN